MEARFGQKPVSGSYLLSDHEKSQERRSKSFTSLVFLATSIFEDFLKLKILCKHGIIRRVT